MMLAALAVAAVLLSVERVFYVWVWHRPQEFVRWCAGGGQRDPMDALETGFLFFKLVQAAVFLGWCIFVGGGLRWPGSGGAAAAVAGVVLMLVGQYLNYSVFRRLGRIGVFYGNRFGHEVPWCTDFPFSVLAHPQYVGAVLSIWGFFLLVGFPQDEWFVLPTLETVFYAAGAYLER